MRLYRNPAFVLTYRVRMLSYGLGRPKIIHNWSQGDGNNDRALQLSYIFRRDGSIFGAVIENQAGNSRGCARHQVGKVEFKRLSKALEFIRKEDDKLFREGIKKWGMAFYNAPRKAGAYHKRIRELKELETRIVRHIIRKIENEFCRYEGDLK